jgi:hypothetical protein
MTATRENLGPSGELDTVSFNYKTTDGPQIREYTSTYKCDKGTIGRINHYI